MDLEETIEGVLRMFQTKLLTNDYSDPSDLISDIKRRIMLVCLTTMTPSSDDLLSHLPPLTLPDEHVVATKTSST